MCKQCIGKRVLLLIGEFARLDDGLLQKLAHDRTIDRKVVPSPDSGNRPAYAIAACGVGAAAKRSFTSLVTAMLSILPVPRIGIFSM